MAARGQGRTRKLIQFLLDGADSPGLLLELERELSGVTAQTARTDVIRTVVEGAGECADAGQDGGREGFEGADGVGVGVAAVGAGAAFVARIEQATQFLALGEVGVYFVKEQGGLVLIDEAEEDRRSEVFGADGPGDHAGDNVEGGGFATTRLG